MTDISRHSISGPLFYTAFTISGIQEGTMMASIPFDLRRVQQLCGLAACLTCLAAGAAAGQDSGKTATPDGQGNAGTLVLPPDILETTWEWTGFQTPKDAITVDDPTSYTLTFTGDGAVALQVDCNRGFTSYVLGVDNRITFEPIGTTMMMCGEDSLDHDFTTNLERVSSFFQFEGDLLLEQPFDSGTLRFRPAATEAPAATGSQ
jgi:heat shock protein HslJ